MPEIHFSPDRIKRESKKALKSLQAKGCDISLGEVRELLTQFCGFDNWDALAGADQGPPTDQVAQPKVIKKFKPTGRNTNCLVDVVCPECGQEDSFDIVTAIPVNWADDGTDPHSDSLKHTWGYDIDGPEMDDPTMCPECKFHGTYADFYNPDGEGEDDGLCRCPNESSSTYDRGDGTVICSTCDRPTPEQEEGCFDHSTTLNPNLSKVAEETDFEEHAGGETNGEIAGTWKKVADNYKPVEMTELEFLFHHNGVDIYWTSLPNSPDILADTYYRTEHNEELFNIFDLTTHDRAKSPIQIISEAIDKGEITASGRVKLDLFDDDLDKTIDLFEEGIVEAKFIADAIKTARATYCGAIGDEQAFGRDEVKVVVANIREACEFASRFEPDDEDEFAEELLVEMFASEKVEFKLAAYLFDECGDQDDSGLVSNAVQSCLFELERRLKI